MVVFVVSLPLDDVQKAMMCVSGRVRASLFWRKRHVSPPL